MSKIIYVTGVSGSGKTSIGQLISDKLKMPFFDGDDFHPQENIQKMVQGIPLNDKDRRPWLQAIWSKAKSELSSNGCIIACSALKERYRTLLTDTIPKNQYQFIHLQGDFRVIKDRIEKRKSHFMPPELLQSQFDDYEVPSSGLLINVKKEKEEILDEIMSKIKPDATVGIFGLGVMGTSLARNMAGNNISLALYNRFVADEEEKVAERKIKAHPELASASAHEAIETFVDALEKPRKIMLMVPAGQATDDAIDALLPLLSKDDLIVDGGNAHYQDTQRRYDMLTAKGIHFVGCGVSGGEKGALEGPSMMPGGSMKGYDMIQGIFKSIAAKNPQGEACCDYIGAGGAGHFVKMVHNGIEYAEMQLIAECYSHLKEVHKRSATEIANIFQSWSNEGEQSYLLDITAKLLQEVNEDGAPIVDHILDKAGNKGTGSWTTMAACELGVAIPTLTAALFARFQSAKKEERLSRATAFMAPSGIEMIEEAQLKTIYRACRILNHRQGIELIRTASSEHQWAISTAKILHVWSEGCIIKSPLLQEIAQSNEADFIESDPFRRFFNDYSNIILQEAAKITASAVPAPCINASIDYFKQLIQPESNANLIQAQRDYFGAHTFKWKSNPHGASVHYHWTERE